MSEPALITQAELDEFLRKTRLGTIDADFIERVFDHIEAQAAEIERLKQTERLMDAFVAVGVNNWEGYDEAVAQYDAAAKGGE